MHIRPETLRDYAGIHRVHERAFGEHYRVALIVSMHRYRSVFDPELSLVAEIDGQIVGHVLFSAQTIRLLNENVSTVNLSPLAIDPAYQRQGIGGTLIEEGHRIARRKGYELSFLLGHSDYYPRFGYKTHAYGASAIKVETGNLLSLPLETRAVAEAHIPLLRQLWLHEEGKVDFAIDPGDTFSDWISQHPFVDATVYVRDDEIVGYARVLKTNPTAVRYFLAADLDVARSMAAQIGQDVESIELPLHPYSASAPAFGTPEAKSWAAGMVCNFSSELFDDYYQRVQRSEHVPGRALWSTAFDLSE